MSAALVAAIERVHVALRTAVLAAMAREPAHVLRAGDEDGAGDTIYGIDRVAERDLLDLLERELAPWAGSCREMDVSGVLRSADPSDVHLVRCGHPASTMVGTAQVVHGGAR